MRTSWLVWGVVLGLVGYYVYSTQEQEAVEGDKQPQTKPMNQSADKPKGEVRSAQTRPEVATPAREKQPVAAGHKGDNPVVEMVDEMVHHQDIPETPIKQAFEHALES